VITTTPHRVALVTGSNGGIGSATVRALVAAGVTTYASARRPQTLTALIAEGARPLELDVANSQSREQAVRSIINEQGRIDVLVNNAGFAIAAPMEELSLESLQRQFDVNVFGMLGLTQLVLPIMRQQATGRVINIGSVGGLFTAPGAGAYHMSKYAVESLSDALRIEVARFGIRVSLLEPTGVRTAFAETQLSTMPDTGPNSPYALFKANMDRGVRRLFAENSRAVVTPEQVARVVVQAATSQRPRPRYKVGAVAHILPRLRVLMGDRNWDKIATRQFAAE
jgi:NAD(P)-dependent dehydrogenase (short-subunit alcohol dehydrogenase family)